MEDIKTPALIVNEAICRKNIEKMAKKAMDSEVVFRPHFKAHNSIKVGRWFRDVGVQKITVSSFSMAKFFAEDGWDDIMVAFPFNQREIDELNELSEKINISILLSGNESLPVLTKKLKNNVDYYIKINVGLNRTGYKPDSVLRIEKMLDLAEMNEKLNFKGFVAHAGHSYKAKSTTEIRNIYKEGVESMNHLKNDFVRRNSDIIISWGDTPTCTVVDSFEEVDEIRPGNFVYYDLIQLKAGICKPEDIAAVMAATVVAKDIERHEVLVYGGAVHLSKDYIFESRQPAWGRVVFITEEGWKFPLNKSFVRGIFQEHGIIKIKPDDFISVEVGGLIGIIPVHSCLASYHLKNNIHYI